MATNPEDTKPNRQGAAWETTEKRQLYDLYTGGKSLSFCAEQHQRSKGSIRAALKRLGLIDASHLDIVPWVEFAPTTKRDENLSSTPLDHSEKNSGKENRRPSAPVNKETELAELLENKIIDERVYRVLTAHNYSVAGDLLSISEQEFLRYDNLGRKSLKQISYVISLLMPSSATVIGNKRTQRLLQPIQTASFQEDLEFVRTIIEGMNLDERTKDILVSRLGLVPEQGIIPLRDISDKYSVSRERIRQLANKGLVKLRSNLKRNYTPHPRYIDVFERDMLSAFQQLSQQIDEELEDHSIAVLCQLLILFALPDLSLLEAKSQVDGLVKSFYAELKKQVAADKSRTLTVRELRISELLLRSINSSNNRPDDPFLLIGEPRPVQDSEYSGSYFSRKAGREIQYESLHELNIFRMLEKTERIKWYDAQRLRFQYQLRGLQLTYHPDIICTLDDGSVVVVEVKPVSTMALLKTFRKALVAKAACVARGWHYVILSYDGGTLSDVLGQEIPLEAQNDFIAIVGNKEIAKREGIDWQQMKLLMKKYQLSHRTLTSLALKNDLAFIQHPFICGRLPEGISWEDVLPVTRSLIICQGDTERESNDVRLMEELDLILP